MNRISYYFGGFLLLAVLAMLIWAAKTHEDTLRDLPMDIARDLRPLLLPTQMRDIDLSALGERVEDLVQSNPYVLEIILRKVDENGNVRTVYPYFYDFDHPDFPPEQSDEYRYQPIVDHEKGHLGDLYIRIDHRKRWLYIGAIFGSIAGIAVLGLFGFYALQTKEEEVRKTSTLLEEKQRELIHLERLAMVGQVTANLLHDLKKPVLNIRAEAESMEESPAKKTILEEADLFISMIRELHLEGFLRRDAERAEFLDLAELVERSVRLVKYAQNHVNIDVDLPETLPLIFGQRHQLIQVFSNLLVNAFQALEGEGSIRISGSTIQRDQEDWLEIALTDDGPGIPYEILSNIFEPFYSTRKDSESTGLGLYITKSIVTSMGGAIEAHSIPRHGTTFTIRFPISQEEWVDNHRS